MVREFELLTREHTSVDVAHMNLLNTTCDKSCGRPAREFKPAKYHLIQNMRLLQTLGLLVFLTDMTPTEQLLRLLKFDVRSACSGTCPRFLRKMPTILRQTDLKKIPIFAQAWDNSADK
jgi:hypothetical protein